MTAVQALTPSHAEQHRRWKEAQSRLWKKAPEPLTPAAECQPYRPPHSRPWLRPTIEAGPLFTKTRAIQLYVCAEFGVRLDDLVGPSRLRPLTRARQAAMYLLDRIAGLSLPVIGRRLGDRDHTTALHGIRKTARLIETDQDLASRVSIIRERIEAVYP